VTSVAEKLKERFPDLLIEGFKGGDKNNPQIPRDPPIPMDREELTAFETDIGAKLPPDHAAFLLEIGGASFLRVCVTPIQTRDDYGDIEIFEVLYAGRANTPYDLPYDLWSARENYADCLPDSMIPIGENPFGDQFCIGIKGPNRGKVYFWSHDDGKTYLTADSFTDFLNRLRPYPYTG